MIYFILFAAFLFFIMWKMFANTSPTPDKDYTYHGTDFSNDHSPHDI